LIRALETTDKLLHFSAYAGLAFLVALNWWLRRPFGWRQGLVAVALVAVYGMVDELTQIPVGRDCELFDWVADLAGSASGVAFFLAAMILCQGAALRSARTSSDEAERSPHQ
jgi:VanZ family protein